MNVFMLLAVRRGVFHSLVGSHVGCHDGHLEEDSMHDSNKLLLITENKQTNKQRDTELGGLKEPQG